MSESEDDSRTFVTVAIEARRWQGLKFEADLLTQVFRNANHRPRASPGRC